MDKIAIEGGYELNGALSISGAKNAALPLMCACLLTDDDLTLSNNPHLRDIASLNEVLTSLGVTLAMSGHDGRTMTFNAGGLSSTTAAYELVRKMRASILVLGPLLAKNHVAKVSLPGGCAIGSRPVDLHIDGLKQLGANIKLEEGYVIADAPKGLKGAHIHFPKVSVGATENILMAATLAQGETILTNAAREPEITDLGECLVKMGAQITGLGSDTIKITGVKKLHGTKHAVIADRIETGTYAIAAAMAGGKLTLKNTRFDFLESLFTLMQKAGIRVEETNEGIEIERVGDKIHAIDAMT